MPTQQQQHGGNKHKAKEAASNTRASKYTRQVARTEANKKRRAERAKRHGIKNATKPKTKGPSATRRLLRRSLNRSRLALSCALNQVPCESAGVSAPGDSSKVTSNQ